MDGIELDKKNIKKLISTEFFGKFEKKDYVGLEFEFPIVNINKEPVSLSILNDMMEYIVKEFKMEIVQRDSLGNIIEIKNSEFGDLILFEFSYNTLEFAMGKQSSIVEIEKIFFNYFDKIQEFLRKRDYCLTGMGMHPYAKYIDRSPVKNDRYRLLYDFLKRGSEKEGFSEHFDFGSFISSSQLHINVELEDIPKFLNLFSEIEWIKALLFSNSVSLDKEFLDRDEICTRDYLWTNSMFAYNEKSIGTYDEKFENIDELLEDILERSIFSIKRGDKSIFFDPIKLKEYLGKDKIMGRVIRGENVEEIYFSPREEDISYFRSFKCTEITKMGTLEVRSECQQTISSLFAPAAFSVGLVENYNEVRSYIDSLNFDKRKNSEMRGKVISGNLENICDSEEIRKILDTLLNLSYNGLIIRNLGEEIFLKPLYKRAEKLESPSEKARKIIKQGGSIEDVIRLYSKREEI